MEINEFHSTFVQEVNENRQITGSTFEEEFFNTYANYLMENDEIIGEINFLHFEMPLAKNKKVTISGYAYNEQDGILSLIIVDNLSLDELNTLNSLEADRLYKKVKNFFMHTEEISNYGEESNEAVNLAYSLLNRNKNSSNQFYDLNSIKIFIFTDKKITRNLLKTEEDSHKDIKISKQIVGIERIFSLSMSRKGKIDLIIDLNRFQTIPAIKANETDEYESYLCNINGLTLAKLYNEFGSRLIESNVRSFLQTRGKVNKGIRLTILKEPEMFFAYNNGLTCTANSVEFNENIISEIVGLQIVNGGQTTASLANVMLNDKDGIQNLTEVSVPMKLNVIKNLDIEDELIPAISRYANSQNKVSDVDLASNHPFHKKIEELSRKISTPPADGFSHGTYWYYERAAGQYAQETYKMPIAQKNRFVSMNPKKQMFKKSDFAKYFNIYQKRPDIASKGGAAAFKSFSTWIIETWDKDSNLINQEFYKEMIANIIMFKELDKITKSGAGANGYKANINAYTLSYFYWYIEEKLNMKFNYSKIWQRQIVPQVVLDFLNEISYEVKNILISTDGNVTEYAKKISAWENIKKNIVITSNQNLTDVMTSKSNAASEKKEARENEKFESDFLDTALVYKKIEEDPDYYKNMLIFIDENSSEFLPKERNIIAMLATNKFLTDKQSKIALEAIKKAEDEGFGL
ncbi:AIPR family protein [Vagococcus fluvialis]|uniref:AIPR family protein n=1 Tax=Vagococcus fluvialis TaxID=2738 RepID=UPI0022DF870B|nr:AIPR family protein [Vagococcus fluvialis]MDT2745944.1 AIPR family protein [Vagococcus fluvialis]